MDLTTRCPQCGSVFSASLEQLQLRKGYIRCINCAYIFDGYDAVVPNGSAAEPARVPDVPAAPGAFGSQAGTGAPDIPSVVRQRSSQGFSSPTSPAHFPAVSEPNVPEPKVHRPGMPEPSAPQSNPARGSFAADRPAFTISTRPAGQPARRTEPVIPAIEPVHGRPTRVAPPVAPVIEPARNRPSPVNRPDPRAIDSPVPMRAGRADAASARGRVYIGNDIHEDEPAASPSIYIDSRFDAGQEDSVSLPDFLDQRYARRRAFARLFWGILALIGAGVLVAQLAYVYRVQLASQVPALRPVLEQACQSLKCQVAYPRRIQLISIMNSSLQAAPNTGEALPGSSQMTLRIVLRNNFDKPQEWPTLVLDLVDFSGTVVVKKNLAPKAYLPATALQGPFAAKSEISITVPITVIGVKINGYQLGKFFP